jgi:glycosyltransferase involved in cell wall biosynthesis
MPLVTVLLPVRNAAATAAAALDSICQQTVKDLELLAIDDGSTDGSRAVLEAAAAQDARVRVLETGGVGLVGALTLGLAQAQGRLVARMDADDVSLPTRLEVSLAALEADAGLAGVGTAVEIFRDDRPPSPNLLAYGRWLSSLNTCEALFAERFVESPLCHPSVTLRREVLERAGGYREGPFPEDWELWLRLLEGGHRLRSVPQVLHRWRDHDARATRVDARYGLERHQALKADYLAARFRGVPLTLWGAGQVGLGLFRALAARGVTVERFVDLHPRKVGQRIEGVPVIAPQALGPPRPHLLAAVGAKGARAEIRAFLVAAGWREGEQFTCVA